ncbi:MAG: recombinase family protein [Corallococcus sp.]|nr:recombinase family protein [Corallococcus sp.]
MTKTAVIYARYSSDSQTEQSIEGQLRICKEYAQRNNILILDTYIDRAMTGTNDNRPDFQKMIKDSSKKSFDYVLVYKLDRFSRNKYETAIHKKTLKDNGVKVLSAMENIPDTPEGIILESLLEGMNAYYSAELAQKVKRGMRENRIKGFYQGGGVPYGYRVENKKMVIDESKAEVVRFIYRQYSKGVFVKDIIAELASKGILYKGKPFLNTTVYEILANEKYSGAYTKGDEIVDKMYPAIIDKELFEKVRKIVDSNKFGKRSVKTVYLLRNKLKCGYCGRPISADTGTSVNGEVAHYYKCIGRKKDHNGCTKSIIRKEHLEKIVVDSIVEELSKPQIMDYVVKELLKLQENLIADNVNLKILTREKAQVSKSLENLMTAIENGIISKTTNKRLHELEQQQEQLERQILIEKSKTSIRVSEKVVREYYQQALRLEPQMLVNVLIKEIILFDDKIQIQFNNPISKSLDSSQGFSFCTKTYTLTYIIQKHIKQIEIMLEIEMKI